MIMLEYISYNYSIELFTTGESIYWMKLSTCYLLIWLSLDVIAVLILDCGLGVGGLLATNI